MRRIGIYPGSFDPPTLGHLDLIERGAELFDSLIVAVGVNSSKKPFLTPENRLEALRACTGHLQNVEVDVFEGLLIDFSRKKGARSIVRGLRATLDFEYEFQMAMVNRRLAPEIESVFLMTRWDYSYLSSSIVREVAMLGGEFESMVPPPVVEIIRQTQAARTSGA